MENTTADRQELDDATLEPGIVIELREDIEQAEAIEASLKEAIDFTSRVQATPVSEVAVDPGSPYLDTDEDLVDRKRPGSPVPDEEREADLAALETGGQEVVDLKRRRPQADFLEKRKWARQFPWKGARLP